MYKRTSFFFVIIFFVGFSSLVEANEINQDSTITVEQVISKLVIGEDIVVLDVRTEKEYNGDLGHIRGSLLIPLNTLEERIDELEKYKDKQIIVLCLGGFRSAIATKKLRNYGYNALNMLGGIQNYRNKINRVIVEITNQDSTCAIQEIIKESKEQKEPKQ